MNDINVTLILRFNFHGNIFGVGLAGDGDAGAGCQLCDPCTDQLSGNGQFRAHVPNRSMCLVKGCAVALLKELALTGGGCE
jgi:hypothetical protein